MFPVKIRTAAIGDPVLMGEWVIVIVLVIFSVLFDAESILKKSFVNNLWSDGFVILTTSESVLPGTPGCGDTLSIVQSVYARECMIILYSGAMCICVVLIKYVMISLGIFLN